MYIPILSDTQSVCVIHKIAVLLTKWSGVGGKTSSLYLYLLIPVKLTTDVVTTNYFDLYLKNPNEIPCKYPESRINYDHVHI